MARGGRPGRSGKFAKDMVGQRFGHWTVKARAGKKVYKTNHSTVALWLCVCDCGTERVLIGVSLRRGISTQCGQCRERERRKRKADEQTVI